MDPLIVGLGLITGLSPSQNASTVVSWEQIHFHYDHWKHLETRPSVKLTVRRVIDYKVEFWEGQRIADCLISDVRDRESDVYLFSNLERRVFECHRELEPS